MGLEDKLRVSSCHLSLPDEASLVAPTSAARFAVFLHFAILFFAIKSNCSLVRPSSTALTALYVPLGSQTIVCR